jgi:hypothetical protein
MYKYYNLHKKYNTTETLTINKLTKDHTTKGQSESVNQRRADNKGAIRICISKKNRQQRGNQNLYISLIYRF